MGFFDIFKKTSYAEPTLMDDIDVACDWIKQLFISLGYKVDYSIESLKEVDRFIDEQSGPDGIIPKEGAGSVLFSIGSLVGEIAIRTFGGTWVTNNSDPDGDINIQVNLPNGTKLWPVKQAIMRHQIGETESLYTYLYEELCKMFGLPTDDMNLEEQLPN